jgi:hypothetical protein
MNQEEIEKTLKYFKIISDHPYQDCPSCHPQAAKWYFHKGEDYFQIAVFETGEVYQAGTEADLIGVELRTFKDLQIRFTSFTDENIETISDAWDKFDELNKEND